MPDRECEEACLEAYQEAVKNCYRVLFDSLAAARTEEERRECKERFNRCMELSKEARKTCLDACHGQ
ncbi:MAG TPA: hypothetical protein VNL14_07415 [Candidatus Acidoferrales bacterium]|nr:hypothetical protein [Candidatus Acidoferrales bacterium]